MNLFKIIKFDFVNIVKNPVLLLCNTLCPIALIAMMGFITKSAYGSKVTSYDYYGVTMMIYTVMNITLTAANTFMEKKIKSCNIRLIYSPTHTSCIFLSKIISTFLVGSISFTAILLLEEKLLNVNLGGSNFIYILVVIILFTFFMCAFGSLMCCIFKSEEATNKFQSPILMLMAVFGGLLFPIESLGKAVTNISYISPVKWINECVFKIIYNNDFSLFMPVVVALIAGSLILMVLCKIIFKPEAFV